MAAESIATLRVDQIGSLSRPEALINACARYDQGETNNSDLIAAQDQAIRATLARQEAIGFPILSDGEFRRHNFQDSFGEAVSGFDVSPGVPAALVHGASEDLGTGRVESGLDTPGRAITSRLPAIERIQLVTNIPLNEYRFSSSVATRPVKVALIGPDRIAQRFRWEDSLGVYSGLDPFVDDVVAIERRMIGELAEAGCPYIQIDAPGYTAYVDSPSIERMRSRGEDPEANFSRSIKADNAIIQNFPGVTFGIHICRGNARMIDENTGRMQAQWHREGHYDAIAERLFGELSHQRFLLEYDSDRSGSFEPLRFIPKGKIAVLGLVSTKTTDIESVDDLKRRIDEASRYLPIEQLAISPQCGFGSGSSRVTLSEDHQWRKLEALLETASQVWG
jgi:5-methyltetrahydropteroyltriglutamate--homocysteine methyltransferase